MLGMRGTALGLGVLGLLAACGSIGVPVPDAVTDDAGPDTSTVVLLDGGSDGSGRDDSSTPDSGLDARPGDASDGATDGATDAAPVGAVCRSDAECASGGCDYSGHCAAARSCTGHEGGDTCGPAGNESCCTSIAVAKPGAPYKLDKYSITAGRFRAFIEKTGGNVRGYIQANRPSWFEPVWDAWVPRVMDDGTAVTGASHLFAAGQGRDGVYQQLGPIHYGAAEAGGNEGCLTKFVGNARTYRLPDAVNASLFDDVQQYPQAILDQKPQQCTTFFMFAAFCAWDGGRLPTLAELDYAWDKGQPAQYTYPWGNTPVPGGWDNAYPFDPTGKGFGSVAPAGADQTRANYKYNFWMPATMACTNDDPSKCDYSVFLAPPGRFPAGNGPFGHADLAGAVYNVAMPMSGAPGTDPATRTVGLARTGAFDNHAIPVAHPVPGFRSWSSTNKYLATGGRCAR